MCRDNNHGGRRCPNDTSEARRLRRHNAALRARHQKTEEGTAGTPLTLERETVEDASVIESLEERLSETAYTAEQIQAIVAEYNELLENRAAFFQKLQDEARAARLADPNWEAAPNWNQTHLWQDALLEKVERLGEAVEYVAETKYGAPTEEEIAAVVDQLAREKEERADEIKSYGLAEKAIVDMQAPIRSQLQELTGSRYDRAVWKEQQPELLAQLVELEGKASEQFREQQKLWDEQREATQNSPYAQMLTDRAHAYKQALEEAGVQFADPDSLDYSKDSHKKAIAGVKAALAFYPQTWVDRSNQVSEFEGKELRLKETKGRAHYSSGKTQRKSKKVTKTTWSYKPAGWTPDPNNIQDLAYEKVAEISQDITKSGYGDYMWKDPDTGMEHFHYVPSDGEQVYRIKQYEYHFPSEWEPTPYGPGWEGFEVDEVKYNPETGKREKTGNKVIHSRRPKQKMQKIDSPTMAELTVSGGGSTLINNTHGYEVAMHEFAHRSEHAVPGLYVAEAAFLRKRAGEEGQTFIYKGKSEKGYKDNFASHYMGKTYNDDYREILSMGMETLFAGSNGGFTGHNMEKGADPDYKRFVLGLLATGSQDSGVKYVATQQGIFGGATRARFGWE